MIALKSKTGFLLAGGMIPIILIIGACFGQARAANEDYGYGKLVFSDDFSEDSGRWEAGGLKMGSSEIKEGVCDINAYVAKSWEVIAENEYVGTNYAVEVRIKVLEWMEDGMVGIRLCAGNKEEMMVFLRPRKFSFYWPGIKDEQGMAVRPYTIGKWYKLRVERRDNQFTIYLDDAIRGMPKDTPVTGEGKIGLWTHEAHAQFDDVKIWELKK